MTADLRQAERLLGALGGRFTFQTFDDNKAHRKRRDPLSRILHGTLAEHADKLADLNARGAGVFVMVNEGDGTGRSNRNVRRIRAYFADFDGNTPPDVSGIPLRPHAVIESSPGRWHWYWFVDGARLEAFGAVQSAIAARFGSDPSIKDLARVMRLPGFLHQKHAPFQTRIVELHEGRFIHADFVQAFGIDVSAPSPCTQTCRPAIARDATVTRLPTAQRHRQTLPAVIAKGERNTTLLSLGAGLVRKGHDSHAVTRRLQRINAKRCAPPLDATEVDAIALRAIGYGSDGFAMLPHKLLDAPEWKALPPAAHDVIVAAFRRYDGTNGSNIALTWADFRGREGFGQKHTFYRHRAQAVASGILQQTHEGRNGQTGHKPDLFGIAPQWLRPSASVKKGTRPQCQKGNPYIDKQVLEKMGCRSAGGGVDPAVDGAQQKRSEVAR